LVVFRTPILLGCGAGKGRPADLRLAARVLGDGLGALADGVLGQLSRQDEADRSLDLARAQSALLVVAAQTTSLASNALLQAEKQRQIECQVSKCGGRAYEDVVDEQVHVLGFLEPLAPLVLAPSALGASVFSVTRTVQQAPSRIRNCTAMEAQWTRQQQNLQTLAIGG